MTYMTFKIKIDWLFKVLLGLGVAANLFFLYFLCASIANGATPAILLSVIMFLLITAANGYVIFSMTKNYKVGLTKDSVKVSDISNVVIPYTSIRSIKKDRVPSKYKLYDALLVIKYNKYDTVKINCVDLENTFDNLKEMVQKANLDKVVNNVVTMKDGSKEIQQAAAGQTTIIPATTSTSGATIIKPASQMTSSKQTHGALVRPSGASANPNQQTQGALVRPNAGYSQNIVNPNQQTQGALVRPNAGYSQNIVNPNQQTQGALVRPNANYSQNIVNPNQQTQGALVRPNTNYSQNIVNPNPSYSQNIVNPNQQTAGAIVRPTPTPVPTQTAKTVTTTTTTTTKAVPVSEANTSAPTTTTQTIVNPDGSKRVVTTTQTTKKPE